MKAGNNASELQGVRLRSGKATWTLEGDLTVGRAEEIRQIALTLSSDAAVKSVKVVIPTRNGVPLACFQVLTAFGRTLNAVGKAVEIEGVLQPFGGRAW